MGEKNRLLAQHQYYGAHQFFATMETPLKVMQPSEYLKIQISFMWNLILNLSVSGNILFVPEEGAQSLFFSSDFSALDA